MSRAASEERTPTDGVEGAKLKLMRKTIRNRLSAAWVLPKKFPPRRKKEGA
jgi:hypothetical protein